MQKADFGSPFFVAFNQWLPAKQLKTVQIPKKNEKKLA